jgi:hypothetical protein
VDQLTCPPKTDPTSELGSGLSGGRNNDKYRNSQKGENTMTTEEKMNPKKTARIAGFGYLIDFVTFVLFPNFPSIAWFTWWGELLIALWLLIKGVNVEQWEKRALESA